MNLIAVLLLLGAFTQRYSCGSESRSDKPVDALKVIASLQHLVLISSTTNAPIFECMTTDRTAFDARARTATYVWHAGGHNGQPTTDITVTYVVSQDKPDSGEAFINSDTSNPIPAQAVYSDYKNCVVVKMFYGAHEDCSLWVTTGTENAVPAACSAAMAQNCPGGVFMYKGNVCN